MAKKTVKKNTSDIVILQGKVKDLENAPDPTPQIDSCLLQAVADLDVVLQNLESEYCTFQPRVGPVTDINTAIGRQCANLNSELQLATREPMTNLTGWKTNVQNFAQSLGNLWLTVCDIRNAVKLIQSTCCQVSCDDITVDFDYIWTDEVTLTAFFVPKTNGGQTCWNNVVTCCYSCNQKKGNKSIKEAGFKLNTIPKKPNRLPYIQELADGIYNKDKGIPAAWKFYLERY